MSEESGPKITIQVIDVGAPYRNLTAQQRIEVFGGDLDHDWRLQITADHGKGHTSRVTMHYGATADSVAEYCQREGWTLPPEVEDVA
jgi:hypothetical protein